jgi:hypothetical protein
MKLTVRTNLDEVLAAIDAAAAAIADVALPRALNKLADQAAVAGKRRAAALYRIRQRDLEPYIRVESAAPGRLSAAVVSAGRGLPVALLGARQTRKGVSFNLHGRQVTIPHAFLGRGALAGNAWARGAYTSRRANLRPSGQSFGKLRFGRGRLPVELLRSVSAADAMSSVEVIDEMQRRFEEQAGRVLAAEIRFALRGRR